jgi:hypothetical protein
MQNPLPVGLDTYAVQMTLAAGLVAILPGSFSFGASNTLASVPLGTISGIGAAALPGPHYALYQAQQNCNRVR